jgi:exopolysaccharide production protein ExoQ
VIWVAGLSPLGIVLLLWLTRIDVVADFRWVPYAWIALMLTPSFNFAWDWHSLEPSPSNLSPENIVQLVAYAGVAGMTLRSRRILVSDDPIHLRTGPILLWPVMALCSALWSITPLFSFVRALQLMVAIGLALLMARIWSASPEIAVALWRQTIGLFIRAVTALIFIGLAVGGWELQRFTWPGAHPGVAAMFIGVGLLILIAENRWSLGLRTTGHVLRLGLFVAALYLGHTRTVIGGVVVAVAVLLWLVARTHPLKSYLGITYYAIAIGLTVMTILPQITEYVYRGQTTQSLESLSGRIPLWDFSIELVSETNRWLIGFGYGSARLLLPESFSWAGTAHSAWIELLLSIGILGPLLAAVDLLFVLRYASSRPSVVPPALTLSLLALLTITSITGEGLALPSLTFVMLCLLHVPVLTHRNYMSHAFASSDNVSRGAAALLHRTLGRGDPPLPIADDMEHDRAEAPENAPFGLQNRHWKPIR